MEIEHFRREGFLFPGRVLTEATTVILRQKIDDLVQAESLPPTITRQQVGYSRDGKGGGQAPILTGLWRTEPLFRAVTVDQGLLGWAGQLLSTSKVALISDVVILKPPKREADFRWHQDAQAVPIDPCRLVSIWIALEDVATANGGMEFVPGSLKLGRFRPTVEEEEQRTSGNGGSTTSDSASLKEMPDPIEMGLPTIPVELKAGECSIHDGLMWHRSGSNRTNFTRHSFILRIADAEGSRYTGASSTRLRLEENAEMIGMSLVDARVFPVFDCGSTPTDLGDPLS
jgi:hypothetical protein